MQINNERLIVEKEKKLLTHQESDPPRSQTEHVHRTEYKIAHY